MYYGIEKKVCKDDFGWGRCFIRIQREEQGQHFTPFRSSQVCAVLQLLSRVQIFVTPWTAACQAFLFFTISEFAQTHVHGLGDVIQSSHPLFPPFFHLPSIFSSISVFSNESAVPMRWPKYWSFSFSISPSNEYSGLISFRIDGFDLLAIQRTVKSLLQHHSLKVSILWHSSFFVVQLSHPYMTTGKTIALTIWTFATKMM